MDPLTNAEARVLKARAQRLKASLKLGKEGMTEAFLKALDAALQQHELIKVKFEDAGLKEQKKELAPVLAKRSHSHLVTRVGNVVVLYRRRPSEVT